MSEPDDVIEAIDQANAVDPDLTYEERTGWVHALAAVAAWLDKIAEEAWAAGDPEEGAAWGRTADALRDGTWTNGDRP